MPFAPYQLSPIDLRTLALWSARFNDSNALIEHRMSTTGMPELSFRSDRTDVESGLEQIRNAEEAIREAVAEFIGIDSTEEIFLRVDSKSAYRSAPREDGRITLQTAQRKARSIGLTKQKLDDILQRAFAEKIAQLRNSSYSEKDALSKRVGGVSAMSFNAILADDALSDLYFAHAKRESCRENINFLSELRDLENLNEPGQALRTAQAIVHEFCRSDSHQSVDLPADLRSQFDSVAPESISLEQIRRLLGCDASAEPSAKSHVGQLMADSTERFCRFFHQARECELDANPTLDSLKKFASTLEPEDQIRKSPPEIGQTLYAKDASTAMRLLNPRSWFQSGRRQHQKVKSQDTVADGGQRFRNAKLAVRDALATHFGGDELAMHRANEMMSVLLMRPGAMTKEDLVQVIRQAEAIAN